MASAASSSGLPGRPGGPGERNAERQPSQELNTSPGGRRGAPEEDAAEDGPGAETAPAAVPQQARRRRRVLQKPPRGAAAATAAAAAAPEQQEEGAALPPDTLGPPEEYDFPHVAGSAWGRVYLFTTHASVDKETLLAAVRASYRAVFPVGHLCAGGPKNATVAREVGRRRPRRQHLHLAGECAARHRWKQVRDELARTHGIQARLRRLLWEACLSPVREVGVGGSAALLRGVRAPRGSEPIVPPNVPPNVRQRCKQGSNVPSAHWFPWDGCFEHAFRRNQ